MVHRKRRQEKSLQSKNSDIKVMLKKRKITLNKSNYLLRRSNFAILKIVFVAKAKISDFSTLKKNEMKKKIVY